MELSESKINYLKVIYKLEEKNRVARVKDIANELSVTMASVTSTIKILNKANLVSNQKNSFILLTDEGKKIAKEFYNNYERLVSFCTDTLEMETEEAEICSEKLMHAFKSKDIDKLTAL